MKFNTEIFSQYDKKWALLSVGKPEDFNTMTISWGGLGTLWNKPVAAGDSVGFREAEVTLICRKLFVQELELDRIPADIRASLYADGDIHDMYIGEVVDIQLDGMKE